MQALVAWHRGAGDAGGWWSPSLGRHRAAARGERARVGAAEAADLLLGLAFARICLRGAGDDVLSRRDEDVLVSTIIGGAA